MGEEYAEWDLLIHLRLIKSSIYTPSLLRKGVLEWSQFFCTGGSPLRLISTSKLSMLPTAFMFLANLSYPCRNSGLLFFFQMAKANRRVPQFLCLFF